MSIGDFLMVSDYKKATGRVLKLRFYSAVFSFEIGYAH